MNSNTRKRKKTQFDLSDINPEDYYKKGIYKITNKINGHFYIGSASRDIWTRIREHDTTYKKSKNGGKLKHPILWAAYDKYGPENFKCEVVETVNDDCTLKDLLAKEGYYIRTLKPQYNICQSPEKGGIPNKDRKLSEVWKQRIAEKSAQYKHDAETLALVTKNNKENACKIKLYLRNELKFEFNSWVEFTKCFKIKSCSAAMNAVKYNKTWHGYTIVKETSQKKRIKVFFDGSEIIYNSFNECDRALNMWRGYTSTMYTRGIKVLKDKYKYEII